MKPRISSKWRDAVDVSLCRACSQSEGLRYTIKKTEAIENPAKAREIFHNITAQIPPSSWIGYTDSSVNSDSAACAFTFPKINVYGTFFLTKGSSILSAELHGIKKALEASYHHDTTPEEVYIFSNSRAALLAINATSKDSQNPALLDIWDTLHALRTAGTYLTWIPSHIGIYGNKIK
ncbi:hypothetical protein OUZ56_010010 [Daphnia magna]|uniref:RNase H type-1 domain-containing protein n=1 Tax=Daphnia magna TaxID=35525 RepID=A0ABR0AHI8_9CRUS|nr:hypothetical protein OUZ56_010010 [Daphnia magna]